MSGNLWFFYALSSAVLWGFGYALSERALQAGISAAFFLICLNIFQLVFFSGIILAQGTLAKNIALLSFNKTAFIIFIAALSYCFGNLLIFQAVFLKNAAYANLIEISYPFFTILFSYILFRNFEITFTSVIGGCLILSGIALIYLKG